MATISRVAQLLWVAAVVALMIVPVLPAGCAGSWPGRVATWERFVSIKQGWQMYSPNPQRSVSYMNLDAVAADGTRRELEETEGERRGWGTAFAWTKTRMDIWRQYANFSPKKGNRNRVWYLKAVCVREARRGETPAKIVMRHVRRRITAPHHVRAGAPELGPPTVSTTTVQYCKTPEVLDMIAADQARSHAG